MTCTETTSTSNPYSYVCERLPLKYMQTRVCKNSYTGTRKVPDLYSCLCERSLTKTTTTVTSDQSHSKQDKM